MEHIVVDLEMNPVGRDFKEVRKRLREEIIEFGAVKLDESFQQIGEFQCYVKPEYGNIKRHIIELTGITDEMVADKEHFIPCFNKFMEWVGDGEVKIYSWSMSDLKQMKNECRVKVPDFPLEKLDECWVDLQREFDNRLGLHQSLALKHALGAINRDFEGTAHTALADSINTAAILILMQDDEKFRETMKPIIEVLQPHEDLSSSIGELCPELMKFKVD